MTVQVEWDNDDQTILRYIFAQRWHWNDYRIALAQGREMMAQVAPRYVCVYNDMRAVKHLPPNLISTAQNVIASRPDNTGLAVLHTNNRAFDSLYNIIARLIPDAKAKYLIVQTEEQAYDRLQAWLRDNQNANSI